MTDEKLIKQAIKKAILEVFPDGLQNSDKRYKEYMKDSFAAKTDEELQAYLDGKKHLEYDFCGNYYFKDISGD